MQIFSCYSRLVQDIFFLQNIQHRQSSSATNRVAGISVAVYESFMTVVIGIKGVINLFRGNSDGHGQITTGQALGSTQDIRTDAGMFYGKEFAGTAKAGGNLVVNHEDSILIAQLTQFL